MRLLFYLPIVTPWWFSEYITPMIRAVHGDAEVHVIIAPLWRGTGIEAEHLAPLADLDTICWHIIDGDDGERFRTDGTTVDGLRDLVLTINPDLTLARSADTKTPALFPGTVRYIMESQPPPFEIEPLSILVEETPFALGVMPDNAGPVADRCVDAFADVWQASDRYRHPTLRTDWRTMLGLPPQRPILAVPLHYEHEENFFLMNSGFPHAVDLIRHLDRTLDKEIFLAVSDHPLNRRYVDRSEINELLLKLSERAAFCHIDRVPGGTTNVLAAHADALLIDQSKSWSLAAHTGTPMVNVGRSELAPWLHATALNDKRLAKWTGARLAAPDAAAAQRYFCWHLGARAFDPRRLSLDRLLMHVSGQVSDAIIDANADILRQREKEAA